MRNDLTDISVVLDKSSSMFHLTQETIDGFNQFIEEQRKLEGDANLTLTQFDTNFNIVHNGVNIKDVPELNHETYRPNGYTALHDAVGKTIVSVGQRLEALQENERPSKVIMVIMTDGEENSSKEFSGEKIAGMIKHQKDTYDWEFVFLGANQDAVSKASTFGISANMAMSIDASKVGTQSAYASISNLTSSYRGGATGTNLGFTNSDRKAQDDLISKSS
jgi:uncharacterized protein YegL